MLKWILISMMTTTVALAQEDASKAKESDKVDINKLEQKYWSAKDDDFTVVQNRAYTKANRFYLSLTTGVPFNDPYSTGNINAAELGYYFSERLGVNLYYAKGNMRDNDATDQFEERFGVYPDNNKFAGTQVLSATFVPFYAKMSFLDKKIIYFDMGFSLGLGTTDYIIKKQEGDENKNAMTYQFGVTQQIFFTNHFALRVDLMNRWTDQKKMKFKTDAPDRDQGSKVVNDSSLLMGLTYWF